MAYRSLKECIDDLEKNGHLVRVKEEVDPYLEMAAIHRRVFEADGPAVFYENVKGSPFPAVSNLFGSIDRSRFIFRETLDDVKKVVKAKDNPLQLLKKPLQNFKLPFLAFKALPRRTTFNSAVVKGETNISDLPAIQCWPDDGGPFITLPAVYTEDIDKPGVMNANLGMYRIQLSGNDYELNKELGLHYQIHRGIGVHQAKANAAGEPLKVSVFVGGPPANIFSAVMPLPEGMSELTFAGMLGKRRFRYHYDEKGYLISNDADFVITGKVYPNDNKPEGPFGDHLGYYSLKHDFPVMKVENVYHRKNAIWPFTVVGKPPQEDTQFGAMIHEITGPVIPREIPGLKEVHAVDAAGVHPLLLATGSERYTPYLKEDQQPAEILTIANHILGKGQMSLAKFLFIAAEPQGEKLSPSDIPAFFKFILQRVDWERDVHFYTRTTIDTLDYSGSGLNSGSKVVIAAAGSKKRELKNEQDSGINWPGRVEDTKIALPGVIVVKGPEYSDSDEQKKFIKEFSESLSSQKEKLKSFPLIVIVDDASFASGTLKDFLWTSFTKSNPSHDIHGVDEFIDNKHWGCKGPLIIDARSKPHHAPPLIEDSDVEKRVDRLGNKGHSLHNII